jgi:hypothetical protein
LSPLTTSGGTLPHILQMMIYRNRNYFNNTFRYKKVDENTNDYIGIVYSNRIIKHTETTSVNGKRFHYMPYDYNPRWFFKIIWSLQTWYKRPKKKNINDIIIKSTTSKLLGKILFGLFITVIGGLILLIIWALFETELIEYFRTFKG